MVSPKKKEPTGREKFWISPGYINAEESKVKHI